MQSNNPQLGQWTTGLYDCREDPSNCLITCCVPCVKMGEIIDIVDRGNTPASSIIFRDGWAYEMSYRSKLREQYSLPEEPMSDVEVACCCRLCGICQEYRELKNRGIDPSLGWEGNVKKWERQGIKVPPVAPNMTR